MRRTLVLFAALVAAGVALAQSGEVALGVKAGHNALCGGLAAVSVEAKYAAKTHFAIRGGVQYSTINRVLAEVRPQYYQNFEFGRLSGEVLFNYAYQSCMNSFAIGAGASLDMSPLWITLGYYHRTLKMGADIVAEPFNIYYELGVKCLPKRERWDLNVIVTNSRIFELERHYQPSFAVDGWWYPSAKLGVLVGANYKPAGMFHISSDYYQFYVNIGVCCRW